MPPNALFFFKWDPTGGWGGINSLCKKWMEMYQGSAQTFRVQSDIQWKAKNGNLRENRFLREVTVLPTMSSCVMNGAKILRQCISWTRAYPVNRCRLRTGEILCPTCPRRLDSVTTITMETCAPVPAPGSLLVPENSRDRSRWESTERAACDSSPDRQFRCQCNFRHTVQQLFVFTFSSCTLISCVEERLWHITHCISSWRDFVPNTASLTRLFCHKTHNTHTHTCPRVIRLLQEQDLLKRSSLRNFSAWITTKQRTRDNIVWF